MTKKDRITLPFNLFIDVLNMEKKPKVSKHKEKNMYIILKYNKRYSIPKMLWTKTDCTTSKK